MNVQSALIGAARPAPTATLYGREPVESCFFLDASNTLMSVQVQTNGATLAVGTQAKVFDTKYAPRFPWRTYDVSRNGQQFLMIKEATADVNAQPASLVVVGTGSRN